MTRDKTELLAAALVAMIVAFSPENWLALAASALAYAVAMYAIAALKIRYELRTYSEIVAFCSVRAIGVRPNGSIRLAGWPRKAFTT